MNEGERETCARVETSRAPFAARVTAYAVHVYTASGVVFALLATLEVCAANPSVRLVFIYLIIAVLIDATDGPLARRLEVKLVVPEIDGRKIDDIVDYLTFTFVPLLLVARMEWVPEPALLFVAPPMVASLLGFANTGAKDEAGGFFLGFPSYWNVVAFYLGIAAMCYGAHWLNAIILLSLTVLTLVPVGFIYPNLAPPRWRVPVLGGACLWLLMLLPMLYWYPVVPEWLLIASLVYPVFYVVISVLEHNRYRRAHSTTTSDRSTSG